MDIDEMDRLFKEADSPFGAFDKLENKRSLRPDLHAMMLLDSLAPVDPEKYFFDAVSAAEHDKIWFGFDPERVAAVITPEQIIELEMCNVHYSRDEDGFWSFV